MNYLNIYISVNSVYSLLLWTVNFTKTYDIKIHSLIEVCVILDPVKKRLLWVNINGIRHNFSLTDPSCLEFCLRHYIYNPSLGETGIRRVLLKKF